MKSIVSGLQPSGSIPIRIWTVDSPADLPVGPEVREGDVGICVNGPIYRRDLNSSGWVLKFDPADISVTVDAADVVGFQAAAEGFLSDELAGKSAVGHTHAEADITNLTSDLAGKASSVHTHPESDVTGLVSDLSGKQATLVSATNIKTVNGSSLLGSGDLVIGGAAAWGGITGTLSNQTDLQSALDGKAASLGADDNYATDAEKVKLGNLSGTNTGDQTLPVKATGAEVDTGTDDAKFVTAKALLDSVYAKEAYADGKVADAINDATTTIAPSQNAVFDALALKAALAGPTFTGVPAAPTAGAGTNTTQLATTAFATTADNLKANIATPSFTGATLTLADAQDIVINATTGSKIGQAGSKVGFYGIAPAVRPTTLTQTYATTSATHAAVTQLAAPAGGTGTAAGGYDTAANRNLAITSINAARTDIANLKNFVNQIVDQLQLLGLLQ